MAHPYLLIEQQKQVHIWTEILIEINILSCLIKDYFGTLFLLKHSKALVFLTNVEHIVISRVNVQ